jgi:hypothetical protein
MTIFQKIFISIGNFFNPYYESIRMDRKRLKEFDNEILMSKFESLSKDIKESGCKNASNVVLWKLENVIKEIKLRKII